MSRLDRRLNRMSPQALKVALCYAVGELSTYGIHSSFSPEILMDNLLDRASKSVRRDKVAAQKALKKHGLEAVLH